MSLLLVFIDDMEAKSAEPSRQCSRPKHVQAHLSLPLLPYLVALLVAIALLKVFFFFFLFFFL